MSRLESSPVESHLTLPKLAAALGADFHVDVQSPDDRIRLLQYCRRQGFKVAYVGDCRIDPRTVAEAHVAISLVQDGIGDLDNDPAPIQFLLPRLSKLNQLWDIASIHQRRLQVAQRYAMIPNLLCVAGAFVWGFTSLASVVVTNLGTYSVYRRTAASIRSLQAPGFSLSAIPRARKIVTQVKSPEYNGEQREADIRSPKD